MLRFRCRTKEETLVVYVAESSTIGDLLKEISDKTNKPERNIKLGKGRKGEDVIPLVNLGASLESLGLGCGGNITVTFVVDKWKPLDVGGYGMEESDTFKDQENFFNAAHDRALSFGFEATTGLGLTRDGTGPREVGRGPTKPGVRGIITASISTNLTLADKFAVSQPGYLPGGRHGENRRKRSRSKERTRKRSLSRSRSRGRRRGDRDCPRDRDRQRRSRSPKKDRQGRRGKGRSRSRSRDRNRTSNRRDRDGHSRSRSNDRNQMSETADKDRMHLLVKADETANIIRDKLKKSRNGESTGTSKVAVTKAKLAQTLRQSLKKTANTDEDLNETNRVKHLLTKKPVQDSLRTATFDNMLEDINRARDRLEVREALNSEYEKDLRSVHDHLTNDDSFAGERSYSNSKTDSDRSHFDAIFAPPAPSVRAMFDKHHEADQYESSKDAINKDSNDGPVVVQLEPSEFKKGLSSWRDKVRARALQRKQEDVEEANAENAGSDDDMFGSSTAGLGSGGGKSLGLPSSFWS